MTIRLPKELLIVAGLILTFILGGCTGLCIAYDTAFNSCVESYNTCEVKCGEFGGINRGRFNWEE